MVQLEHNILRDKSVPQNSEETLETACGSACTAQVRMPFLIYRKKLETLRKAERNLLVVLKFPLQSNKKRDFHFAKRRFVVTVSDIEKKKRIMMFHSWSYDACSLCVSLDIGSSVANWWIEESDDLDQVFDGFDLRVILRIFIPEGNNTAEREWLVTVLSLLYVKSSHWFIPRNFLEDNSGEKLFISEEL